MVIEKKKQEEKESKEFLNTQNLLKQMVMEGLIEERVKEDGKVGYWPTKKGIEYRTESIATEVLQELNK